MDSVIEDPSGLLGFGPPLLRARARVNKNVADYILEGLYQLQDIRTY